MSQDKSDAIEHIAEQMKAHGITLAELSKAMQEPESTPAKGDVAMRLFSILGAIFIFSGIGVYISMFWDDMNSFARILITLGSGLVVQFMSLQAVRTERYTRAVK